MLRGLTVLLLPLGICDGQERIAAASPKLLELAARSDSLYFAFRPADALAVSENVFASGEDDAGLRWRAARAAIASGMLRPDDAERRALYDAALRHARRAAELAPGDREASYWVAAAAGRRAHRDDPFYSAKLGREVFERTTAILAIDSMHAAAHHALGQTHAEALRVSPWLRFIAGRVLRVNVLKYASHAEAERHLRRAVELEPHMIQYVVDLAEYLGRRGNTEGARALVARLDTMPAVHPMDDRLRAACVAKWRPADR